MWLTKRGRRTPLSTSTQRKLCGLTSTTSCVRGSPRYLRTKSQELGPSTTTKEEKQTEVVNPVESFLFPEQQTEEKEGKVIRKERHSGSFMRSFNVGDKVRQEDIKASFENGVLTLVAPRVKDMSPDRRKIEIS